MALPMTASTIEDLTDAAELSLPDDVLIELDENDEMQGRGLYGYAWPDGRPAGTHRRTADEQRRTRAEGARGVR